jgi:hypothetical protein
MTYIADWSEYYRLFGAFLSPGGDSGKKKKPPFEGRLELNSALTRREAGAADRGRY